MKSSASGSRWDHLHRIRPAGRKQSSDHRPGARRCLGSSGRSSRQSTTSTRIRSENICVNARKIGSGRVPGGIPVIELLSISTYRRSTVCRRGCWTRKLDVEHHSKGGQAALATRREFRARQCTISLILSWDSLCMTSLMKPFTSAGLGLRRSASSTVSNVSQSFDLLKTIKPRRNLSLSLARR